jgi:hypothetical protein
MEMQTNSNLERKPCKYNEYLLANATGWNSCAGKMRSVRGSDAHKHAQNTEV